MAAIEAGGAAKKACPWLSFVLQSYVMDERKRAEEHLRVIRSLMERATIYRAISAPTALVGSILALALSATVWVREHHWAANAPAVMRHISARRRCWYRFALERIEPMKDGRIAYRMKTPRRGPPRRAYRRTCASSTQVRASSAPLGPHACPP